MVSGDIHKEYVKLLDNTLRAFSGKLNGCYWRLGYTKENGIVIRIIDKKENIRDFPLMDLIEDIIDLKTEDGVFLD